MLLSVDVTNKSFGSKKLLGELRFSIATREKVAIIGRNGAGKTTLFRLLTGQDRDFEGEIIFRRGLRVASTAQEHHAVDANQTVLQYVLANLPDYARLQHIIDTYPDTMGDNLAKITTYTNALEQFSSLGYYTVAERVIRSLTAYQITETMAHGPLQNLSGGQKRFVELVRIEHADADIALIDEPTNHMDHIAKQAFIEWLKDVKHSVVVISHDRDVLQVVERIIEVKDGQAYSFPGNYDAYLKHNATQTAGLMHDFEVGQRTLAGLHKQIQAVRAKKASTNKTPNPFIPLERRLMKEYAALEAKLEKPSFWIDRASVENLGKKTGEQYQKYKAKNIRIQTQGATDEQRELLAVADAQLGYNDTPLFEPVSFRLQAGDRLRLVGRNGVGKTTLIRAVMDTAAKRQPATLQAGTIHTDRKLRLSVYEQEVGPELMNLGLMGAIEHIYRQQNLNPTTESLMKVMSNYLFDPGQDAETPVELLSGGQKARLQIIKMLANQPNLLVLDEPTNHLDLPSIEELENALADYHGALLYVSHDSYFAATCGGEEVHLRPTSFF